MALGLVFDTSLSMEYKDKDKTRLEEAKERAKEIIAKIPDSSLVFVVDSGEPGVPIGLSPAAALKRIEGLAIRAVNRPLNAAMGQVYPAVAECDRPVHVVYVLTDLARTSWRAEPAEGLDQVAKANKGKGVKIATFIWRLTPEEIQNVSIVSAEPESSVVTQGEPVEIRARIRSLVHDAVDATRRVRARRGQEGREADRDCPRAGESKRWFSRHRPASRRARSMRARSSSAARPTRSSVTTSGSSSSRSALRSRFS